MAATRKDHMWIGGGIAAALAIAASSYFLLISPQFDAKAEAEDQLANTQTQNLVLRNRIDTLRDQSNQSEELNGALAELQAAVPSHHDLEGFTRQLTAFATSAGVTIASISPAAPTIVTRPDPTTAPSGDEGSEDSGTSDDPAPSTAQQPPAEDPDENLYSIAITVVTNGSMTAQQAFLSALEKEGARRSLVTNVAFTPIEADEQLDSAPSGPESPSPEGDDVSTIDDAAPSTPAAPSASSGDWSLTTQLLIFVAPSSAGDESQLLSELSGTE